MSVFTDQMYHHARTSPTGLTTGLPDDQIRHSWAEIHQQARRIAGALAEAGIGPGSAVAVLAGGAADVAPVAQAVWMRGAALTMLQQPTPRTDLAVWLHGTARAAEMIGATVTLVGAPFDAAIEHLVAAGQRVITVAELRTGPDIEPLDPPESAPAMYQLTSGSTGVPKAVEITHANLLANSVALAGAVELDITRDVMVTWLPLSHDMGMVGFLTHPMQLGAELVAIGPDQFLRRPALWPELIGKHGGTITAGPNFAYALLARTLERAESGTYDLSSLRIAINGAEPIDHRDVVRLADAGARFGLPPGAVVPAYGMAETTLGISFAVSADVVAVDTVCPRSLHADSVARPQDGPDARRVVSLGRPLTGMEVRIVDAHRQPRAARAVGVIEVRGAAVSPGYVTVDGWLDGPAADGWLDTGDLGYLDEHGAVHVCGRKKDTIVIAGKNIYPTDIERAATEVEGVRAGNAAAVRIDSGTARESFAVLVESAQAGDEDSAERIRAEISRRVSATVGYNPRAVLVLTPGVLPKTPSGKLQRAKAADLFVTLSAESRPVVTA